MGLGPSRLLAEENLEFLRQRGHDVERVRVDVSLAEPRDEVAASFRVMRAVRESVRSAVEAGKFPFVVSGNCNSALGTLSGLRGDPGIIWFDAHGDLNTPETTPSGYLDGMALAQATGLCWGTLTKSIPGFRPVPESDVVLIAARDLDPGEEDLLKRSPITWIRSQDIKAAGAKAALEPSLAALSQRTAGVYLHIDLDVLDPEVLKANMYASPGGLTLDELQDAIETIVGRLTLEAAGLAAYDPAADEENKGPAVASRLIDAVLAARRE
jgi:arginase